MNILDVVSWESTPYELAHKFPSDELRLGSQLVVYQRQTAFFVKGGKVFDQFTCGTYTIHSANIPLLGKVVNMPFNNETPFKADVWFVNQLSLLDCKWGTAAPLQMEDPKYDVIVPVRAFGQYGFTVTDPAVFFERLVGNMPSFTTRRVCDYFRGVILSKLTAIIYDHLKSNGQSLLQVGAQIETLSEYAHSRISEIFLQYGITIELFNIVAITIQEDDPSFRRLKEAKDAAAKIRIIGRDDYRMTRSFDVLEKAAENEGGAMGTAVGLGAGAGLGGVIGTMTAQTIHAGPATPPSIPVSMHAEYFLAIDQRAQGPFCHDAVMEKVRSHAVTADTLVWRSGMAQWEALRHTDDFRHLFADDVPPPLPPSENNH